MGDWKEMEDGSIVAPIVSSWFWRLGLATDVRMP